MRTQQEINEFIDIRDFDRRDLMAIQMFVLDEGFEIQEKDFTPHISTNYYPLFVKWFNEDVKGAFVLGKMIIDLSDEQIANGNEYIQISEFEALAIPLIDYINENHPANTSIIINGGGAEIMQVTDAIYVED